MLKVKQIQAETVPGRYFDGIGSALFLHIRKRKSGLSKQFGMRYVSPLTGKRREASLGTFPETSLDEARAAAEAFRTKLKENIDPLNAPAETDGEVPSFLKVATDFIDIHKKDWKNQKHIDQWTNTINRYCKDMLNIRVDKIERSHVATALAPIWKTKAETAQRLRGRMEKILDYAAAKHYRDENLKNPAEMSKSLELLIGKPVPKKKRVKHFSAMPWADVPAFVAQLKERRGYSARCLELVILSACRTTEGLGARWSEFDFKNKVWTLPATRTKMERDFRIPITKQMLAVIKTLEVEDHGPLLFSKDLKIPSENLMLSLLKRMNKKNYTVHGFRSSMSDWAIDNNYSADLADKALSHAVANSTQAAYQRSDMLEPRRKMMTDWAKYCWSQRSD